MPRCLGQILFRKEGRRVRVSLSAPEEFRPFGEPRIAADGGTSPSGVGARRYAADMSCPCNSVDRVLRFERSGRGFDSCQGLQKDETGRRYTLRRGVDGTNRLALSCLARIHADGPIPCFYVLVAQMEEHLFAKEEAAGSSPAGNTTVAGECGWVPAPGS